MKNDIFTISIDQRSGALRQIILNNDQEQMNWILEANENPWHSSSFNWGLGYACFSLRNKDYSGLIRWEEALEISIENDSCHVLYQVGPLFIKWERSFLPDGNYKEKCIVENPTAKTVYLDNLVFYTPFNDNYPDASVCVKKRCNAHVWCGGNIAWVNALRMGNEPPHLGMALREGSFSSYEIAERRLIGSSSNVRGTIGLLADVREITAGAEYVSEWHLFPHSGEDDFMSKARKIFLFPVLEAANYTLCPNEPLQLSVLDEAKVSSPEIYIDGSKLKGGWKATGHGEHTVKLEADGKSTFLKFQTIIDPFELIRKRADFIVERQQVNDPDSELDGAFLVYDNEMEKVYCGKGDYNEARERIGMGVMLAQLQRKVPNEKYVSALHKYHQFIRFKIQKPDGTVLNGVNDEHCRPYNYPWAAWFHLEMYKTFKNKEFLIDAFNTLVAFYKKGHEFYAINIPVMSICSELLAAGMEHERKILLGHFKKQAAYISKRGLNYPSHEVVYEQSIVGPAAQLLLELYLVTGDEMYLNEVKPHLKCLEAFNGKQPDFHLNEIAIRHWDGWWFGKRPHWGDTFPHYWSTITANVFHRYWQASEDADYLKRARTILLNNLCLFSKDGMGSCAYVYPMLINGEPGKYYDPYANDQDWALAHYLDIEDDLKKLN